jgi:hypothetical protein
LPYRVDDSLGLKVKPDTSQNFVVSLLGGNWKLLSDSMLPSQQSLSESGSGSHAKLRVNGLTGIKEIDDERQEPIKDPRSSRDYLNTDYSGVIPPAPKLLVKPQLTDDEFTVYGDRVTLECRKLFVKNLSDTMTSQALRECFVSFGDIESAEVHFHPKTKVNLGFGTVAFF